MKKIDITKPVRFVDKETVGEVSLITDKARKLRFSVAYPLAGYIDDDDLLRYWDECGRHCHESILNIENVPEKKIMYVNVYDGAHMYGYATKAQADREASSDRKSCIRIEYEEGQFDE